MSWLFQPLEAAALDEAEPAPDVFVQHIAGRLFAQLLAHVLTLLRSI